MRIEQKLSIPMAIIAVGNIATGVSRGETLLYYILYSGIFLIISGILLSKKIKISFNIFSYLLLVFSLLAIVFNEIISLNGIFFFTYSLYISKKNTITYWAYGSLATIATILRYSLGPFAPSDIFVHLAGLSFILLSYFHYIHPKPQEKSNSINTLKCINNGKVKELAIDIVDLRIKGYDWDEINVELCLNITTDRMRRIVSEERNELDLKTQDAFVAYLLVSGIIKPVSEYIVKEA